VSIRDGAERVNGVVHSVHKSTANVSAER
jgi:hypothetical protein